MRRNPETRLHIAILHYLLSVLPKDAAETLIHVPNGEKRTPFTGALLKRMGTKPGVEDLQFLWRGRLYAIEVKCEGQYLRKPQKARRDAVVAAGGAYEICRSIDDARETLALWGCSCEGEGASMTTFNTDDEPADDWRRPINDFLKDGSGQNQSGSIGQDAMAQRMREKVRKRLIEDAYRARGGRKRDG